MKKGLIGLCAVVMFGVLAMEDADARRLGGARSTGVQRSVPNNPPAATPAKPAQQQAAPNQAAPAQQAQPQPSGLSRWMPKVAATVDATSRARSSAAPREAPTMRMRLPGARTRTAWRAASSRSAAEGETISRKVRITVPAILPGIRYDSASLSCQPNDTMEPRRPRGASCPSRSS